jgi:hypothetical protein
MATPISHRFIHLKKMNLLQVSGANNDLRLLPTPFG